MNELPTPILNPVDPSSRGAWIKDLRVRLGDEEAFATLDSVVGQLGRLSVELAAKLKAKGRGQRGGGSEALDRQQVMAWAERAEDRLTEEEGGPPEPAGDATCGSPEASAPERDGVPAENEVDTADGGEDETDRGGWRPFPAEWPRERVDLPVADELRTCPVCGRQKVCIGHEVSEILSIKPAELFVKQVFREKLACRDGHAGVCTALPEPRLVDQSRCDLSISLDLIEQKLVRHLPLHRVCEHYERLGCLVASSTIDRWYHDVLRALEVVAKAIRSMGASPERFLANIDDTGIKILDRDAAAGRHIGHVWLTVWDNRFVSATVSTNWKKEHAAAALEGWRGFVQCDAYRGFDSLFRSGSMVEVGCWAHARRYFVKAKDRGDKLAEEALGLIGRLYAVEAEATRNELDPVARLELRRTRSRRALDLLWAWQRKIGGRTRPTSPLGKALTYLTNQRRALERFLEDGRLPIDNMVVEREMRPIALGRRNWLFAGSLAAARRLADGLTVIATARMHDVDPVAYLAWLLPQLARRTWSVEAAAASLLPANFQQALKQREAGAGL